ncbi:subtilisin-like protease SBT1.5 [Primulina tabacum]|uniref:subtilisin-like protease SBT1.5 n=1 Tax=Primulina tabacum TaxID=48773 RepID=UPI003F5A9EF6
MGRVWFLMFATIFVSFHFTKSEDVTEFLNSQSTFIVRVQNDMKPSAFSDVEEWYKATLRSVTSNPLNSERPESASQTEKSGDFLHVYRTVFHGFSAQLTPLQAQELKKRPGVLAVLPDNLRQLHTTRSSQFLGLSSVNPSGLLSQSDSGSNVIIGIMDTGIWPERHSFHDEGLGPVPSHWKGQCTEGDKFTASHCNKKIIGARYFTAGYEARRGFFNSSEEIRSARDSDGHGTHTASTAAGRAVANASLYGYASGVAVGVAPKARIASYKICWKSGCMDSDILSAFDKAVEDGVNIISISVGGGAIPYNLDPIAIGAFGAMERGIFVSISAGNEGPSKMTVTNVAPWLTTVGASTIDRKFPADLVLEDGRVLKGASLYSGDPFPEKYTPLIYAGNASASMKIGGRQVENFAAATCMLDSLDKNLVRGKIVVCDRGGNPRVQKGEVVKKAGGAAVVVSNVAPIGEGLVADSHLIPGLGITESAGHTIRHYMNSNPNPRARIVFHGTELGAKPAPVVASFSARGPNVESPYVLKPDIIAPGVNILAAWPDGLAPSELSSDTRRTAFNIASGTSMSCPHVSGAAALLKGAHPDWSPAMIRSALMTTAYTQDNEGKPLLDEKSYNVSTAWDMGAGHVNPEKAFAPGLVYDITTNDYINFLCASNVTQQDIRRTARRPVSCGKMKSNPWDLNYPAISIVFDESEKSAFDATITRTATHVSDTTATYEVSVTSPKGVAMTVNPEKLEFNTKGDKRSYVVRIKAEKLGVKPGGSVMEMGNISWSDGRHRVVSPVVVVWRDGF